MIDRERFHEWQTRADGRDVTTVLDVDKDIRPLADKLIKYGAKVVLIKSGVPDEVLSGTGTGASCVAAYDALSGLKSFEELFKKIENGWEKQL